MRKSLLLGRAHVPVDYLFLAVDLDRGMEIADPISVRGEDGDIVVLKVNHLVRCERRGPKRRRRRTLPESPIPRIIGLLRRAMIIESG